MSNTINSNGKNVGTVNGSEAEYPSEMIRGSNAASNPSKYNSADKYPLAGGDRVRSLIYPQSGGNNHYVRFSINLNEESRLIKSNQVEVTGDANLSEQNRLNRNLQTQDAINAAGTAVGAYAGLKAGAAAGTALKNLFKNKLASGIAGSAITAVGAVAGAAGGAALGDSIGELASEYLKVTNKLKRLAADITLYTPGNIRANYNLSYDMPEDILVALAQSDNFEAIQAGLAAAGTGIAGVRDDVMSGNFGKAASGAADLSRSAGNTFGKFGRIVATGASSTVSMLSRTAINVRRDVMFKHVGNRQFVFEYTFAPKSVTEAKEVADIIFMFKYFAHPEMLQGYGNFLYLYPAEFDIEYGIVPENVNAGPTRPLRNEYLNKISSCVLTDIDVNYAPGGNSFQSLEKGEPIITTLSLVFKEIETLHRERIAQGY